jgi:hypothetical protein
LDFLNDSENANEAIKENKPNLQKKAPKEGPIILVIVSNDSRSIDGDETAGSV